MISLLYAADAPAASQPSPIVSLLPLLVVFVIFYFLLIRPQQKKMNEHKKLLANLKIGDKAVTSSGFEVVVVGLGENSAEVELAKGVRVKILKSAIAEVLGAKEPALSAPAKSDK